MTIHGSLMEHTCHRETLLRSADRLFSDAGFDGISIAAIHDDARVTRLEFDVEFIDKQEIFDIVLEGRHLAWTTRLSSGVSEVDDPRDRILAIFSFLETFQPDEDEVFSESSAWHRQEVSDLIARLARDASLPQTAGSSIALLAEGVQAKAALTGAAAPARDARSAAALLMALYRDDPGEPAFFD